MTQDKKQLTLWRQWALFVFNGGVDSAYGDADLQKQVCARYDADIAVVRLERDKLRAALASVVGASTREELEMMELAIRVFPAPAADKAISINAIQALIDTL